MVVWGLMLSGDDKSVWPDPASPRCIFAVSPGIAATVTAREAAREKRGARRRVFFILLFFCLSFFFLCFAVAIKHPGLRAGIWFITSLAEKSESYDCSGAS